MFINRAAIFDMVILFQTEKSAFKKLSPALGTRFTVHIAYCIAWFMTAYENLSTVVFLFYFGLIARKNKN